MMTADPKENHRKATQVGSPADGEVPSSPSISRRPFSFLPSVDLSERRLLLAGLDLMALNGALLLYLAAWYDHPLNLGPVIRHPLWFGLLSLLWLPLASAFEAYNLRVAARFPTAALAVLKGGLTTAAIYLLIPYLTPALPSSRRALFSLPLLIVGLLVAGRGLYVLALGQPIFRRRVLIVGAGWAGRTIAQVLAEHGDGTYQIVGFVDDDPDKLGKGAWEQGSRGAGEQGSKGEFTSAPPHLCTSAPPLVLGDRHALDDLIAQHGVTTLVLAITDEVDEEFWGALLDCTKQGVEVVRMPVLYEQLTGRVPVEHITPEEAIRLIQHAGTGATWPLVKRAFDVVSAGLGAICLGMAFPFIAAAIYLESPGPILYAQKRVGKEGGIFKVYKFRSMVPDAEKGQAVWAQQDDPRVTWVGRFLRKMHVDEFPQFLNILKGEMSAVGPRPERPEFVEELAEEIRFYDARHTVKPGMAGWGLVKQGYGSSKEDSLLKLEHDLYYIKHQSLWLDAVILLKTIVDTVTFGGR